MADEGVLLFLQNEQVLSNRNFGHKSRTYLCRCVCVCVGGAQLHITEKYEAAKKKLSPWLLGAKDSDE